MSKSGTSGEMGGFMKEQSLALKKDDWSVVITGCSHPVILNIVRKAEEILNVDELSLVAGGFHLLRHTDEQVNSIIDEFKTLNVRRCGATHRTGDHQIEMLRNVYKEKFIPMGTGRIIEFSAAGIKIKK